MIECIATDVATMMVDVTEIQGQVERASGSRLDSSNSPATGVKTALHKLVTKYAGGDVAERLLGVSAKPRRFVTSVFLFTAVGCSCIQLKTCNKLVICVRVAAECDLCSTLNPYASSGTKLLLHCGYWGVLAPPL